jgi:hydrophobic/amphiphilic exporter-1 (mainly G- bacteria), HAE1 family
VLPTTWARTRFLSLLHRRCYPLRPLGMLAGLVHEPIREAMERGLRKGLCAGAAIFGLRHPLSRSPRRSRCFMITIGLIRGGVVPTILFPKSDNNLLQATIAFPDGTPAVGYTDAATRRMEEAIREVSRRLPRNANDGDDDRRRFIPRKGPTGRRPGAFDLSSKSARSPTDGKPAGGGGSGSHVGQILSNCLIPRSANSTATS